MNDWSLVSEYISLILLIIIALFLHGSKAIHGLQKRRNYYYASLILSTVSILLNIACVYVMEDIHGQSTTVAFILNTAYFVASWIMITVMIYYLFLRVLEFVYDKRHINRVRIILIIVLFIFAALLVYNIFSGIIFSFNADGNYVRGPLNAIGYVLPLFEVLMLLFCYTIHRKSVGFATQRVLFVGAPIALLLMVFQMVYPDHLLNGALCAIVNLIIFISYGGDREEQDPLTGLDNRHCFSSEILHRTEGGQKYQIIVIKLRYLSRILRVYGQSGYNTILFQIGEALRLLAGDGMAFRYSEQRFAIMVSDTDEEKCLERLQAVVDRMKAPWLLGRYKTTLNFTAIDFRYNGERWSVDDINNYLSNAVQLAISEDLQMMPFTEQLFCRYQRREYILNSMHTALKHNRFHVWYQPVYYHASGKFESAEALIRMTDAQGNPISPSDFIPIAEETGLIDDIVEFVLENVCSLLASGKIEDLQTISLNLPIKQFEQDNLKDRFRVVLEKYGITPQQIKLEITERDVEESGQAALEVIKDLSNEGYRFMLDDFGIAYSNLSRVLSFPFESIKLDRSLVLLLEEKGTQHNIMKDHIIPIFKDLNQAVVAEGVETAELAEYVLSCGADRIQGYYYAKPMPEKTLIEWYKQH